MTRQSKKGSSRRKGDEYQDLTALQLVLKAYIDTCNFQIFIEYEKAGSFDDIVVISPNQVDGYQVKHAVSDNSVYIADDLTKEDSVVFIEKFSKSWKKLAKDFPDRQLTLHLRSNRALDAQLAEVVTNEGFFDKKFCENRYQKKKRKLRVDIFKSTGLSEDEFQQFLSAFHFDLKQPSWLELEKLIKAELLDHRLGISDRRVFSDLKRLVEHHAIESTDPITPQIIESFLSKTQTRYLLPQSFPVDKERFVKLPSLSEQLDDQLAKADGEYVVVTGPPGSGKSTALTKYCDEIDSNSSDDFVVVRYYCFVRVNDNHQRCRLEANALRVNLLTILQSRFPFVLDNRRFDFSEDRFYNALVEVAAHCGNEGQKLILLLDGLDHVEKNDEIRDSVIAALPADLPENIVVLIGTQELNRWTPLALKAGREERHIEMPLFTSDNTQTYIIDKCSITVSDDTLHKIFEKSSGLPLYLRYLAELLATSDDPALTIDEIPAVVDGDVRTYYETLWATFDFDSHADARYLSSVLASLRFSVHEDELKAFQTGIPDTPRFETAYRQVKHLLRRDDTFISIFHNSFRVFVLEHTSDSTRREIAGGVLSLLRQEEMESGRWFKHAFQYALDASEFDYVVANVNREFVDAALKRFRPVEETTEGIECAIIAAGKISDLVALSRLGSLKYRTHERLEYTFNWTAFTDILLYTGRIDQVVNSIYSEDSERIIAGDEYSLRIILKLVDLGKKELGEKLFWLFYKDFHAINELGNHGIVTLFWCAGVFETSPKQVVRSLADHPMHRDSLEPEELSIEYAPHLAGYLDSLVRSGRDNIWRKLKRVNSPFSNQLMRQLIIRAVATWLPVEQLRNEVEEYIATHPDDTNLELAFYAAKAGLSPENVNKLAGRFDFPPEHASDDLLPIDLQNHILRFAYWAVIFGYDNSTSVVHQLSSRVHGSNAIWACVQSHLLIVGKVLGSQFRGQEIDWFEFATKAIKALESASNVPGERTPDALSAVKTILDRSLGWLSQVITEKCPEKIDDWVALLKRLRSSFIWTTHYGIGESRVDYSFEFPIWNKQVDLPAIRSRIRPILLDCAKSYEEALSLKGGARGSHFLTLAAIAARCGFKNDAEEWLKLGIQTSLAYGYRKDTTLEQLTDVLKILGRYRPEKVLPSAAAILEMIRWIPHATDGRMTGDFAQNLLPVILKHNRAAALEVLRNYYNEFARWQADDSVTNYILARDDGDPEFLWALCGLLDPNNSLEVRIHVASLATTNATETTNNWESRLSNYIRTMITPRYWPDNLWEKATQNHIRPIRQQRNEGSSLDRPSNKKYLMDGHNITENEAVELCHSSFDKMVEIFNKLKQENDYIPDHRLLGVLPEHIDQAENSDQLGKISQFFEKNANLSNFMYWEQIGDKYLSLGDISKGLDCLERAIHESPMSNALEKLVEYDRERAKSLFVRNLIERLQESSYHGFDTPLVVANMYQLLSDGDAVEKIFDDYMQHCQELFLQWPADRCFDELRGWDDPDRDEDVQIVHLLIDRLSVHAAEFGHRLACTLSSLAECRGDKVFPILIKRLVSASGLQLWRLLQVFNRLSLSNRHLFRKHCHTLKSLLNHDNVLLTLSVSRMIQYAYTDSEPMPDFLKEVLDEVDHRYSSTISYRGFSILNITPSKDFVELSQKAVQLSFRRQLKAVCQILNLDLESVTAQLERKLLETGTTLDEEKKIARSMNDVFVHPQGWPIVWFISELHVKISNLLFQIIDEVLLKQRYQTEQVEAIWRIIQLNDPEYSNSELIPIPEDITPLMVEAEDEWIDGENNETIYTIEETLPEGWITTFEFRQLTQENTYYCDYVTQTNVRSALVVPERIEDIISFAPDNWAELVGTHHPAENLTWKQFRNALQNGHQLEFDDNEPCLPFVSYKQRQVGFLGFHTISSLSSNIIREFNLSLDGFSVFADKEQVAFYEAWQEGYSDEDYKDELLSFGVRLQVNSKFLQRVCKSTGRTFAIRTNENRFLFKEHQRLHEQSWSKTSISAWLS